MKLPWKKIGLGLRKALRVSAEFDPRLEAINALVEGVEDAHAESAGATKLEKVEAYSDALIEADLAHLTPEEQEAFKAVRRRYIAAGVTMRNATAELQGATDDLRAAFDAVKAKQSV